MELSYETLDLKLHRPFTISRGTQHYAYNVRVELSDDTFTGIGEAAPSEHYGEIQATVLAILASLQPLLRERPLPIAELHRAMEHAVHLNPAAKAAVDMAAYDLLGKRAGLPVHALLGLDPTCAPRTSFTIGIDTPEVMAEKAREAEQYPILKVKVGTPTDQQNLDAVRAARPDAVIRVDANEAWTPKEAVAGIERIAQFGIEFVEQPVAARDLEGLRMVRDAVSLPVIADESCIVPADVSRVAPYVDGINIKLMKCGGIYPALQMIHLARAHNLAVMMGCMIESSLAMTAAAQLSPLLDYADLDGHLLIDDDPYTGVMVEDGRLVLPQAPGLGVQPR
jgi:L-alanine-DL-glutamate epimerase-like enolase superfamily enzyme